MTTDPTITTNAELLAMSPDALADAFRSGRIDLGAISDERQAGDRLTVARATRIGSAIRAGMSPAEAVAQSDAAN